jgi:hypothetical protein
MCARLLGFGNNEYHLPAVDTLLQSRKLQSRAMRLRTDYLIPASCEARAEYCALISCHSSDLFECLLVFEDSLVSFYASRRHIGCFRD